MDNLTRNSRSILMSRIRGDDLKPEVMLRMALRKLKIEFCENIKSLPGKPDLYFPQARLAVFVHGCFWHGCPRHFRAPKSNRKFWSEKIIANRRRDRRTARKLNRLGIAVRIVWEHSVRCDLAAIVRRISDLVQFRISCK